MKCVNPIVSGSYSKFEPVSNADKQKGHYLYYTKEGKPLTEKQVTRFPCRKCYYCMQARAREWTLRCACEAQFHKDSCILTLTYKVSPREVMPEHMTKFLKRLRRYIAPVKVRYFYGAEYGSKTCRPHYHMILFGWKPPDPVLWVEKDGRKYYTSDIVHSLWTHGLVTIDLHVTDEGIGYTCGYITSKFFAATPKGCRQPFQRMSNRPGIGFSYYENNAHTIYSDGFYFDGKKVPPPKYWDNKYKELIGEERWSEIREKRMEYVRTDSDLGHLRTQEDGIYRVRNLLQKAIDKRSNI